MNIKIHNTLNDMRSFLKGCEELWGDKIGGMDRRRFWNLLRADLMRIPPEQVATYLNDGANKLAEVEDFTARLVQKYFATADKASLAIAREALICACLEIDAALRLKESKASPDRKEQLAKALHLWEVQ